MPAARLGVGRGRTEDDLAAPVFVGGHRLAPTRWLRRFRDPDLARAALVAEELRAVMAYAPAWLPGESLRGATARYEREHPGATRSQAMYRVRQARARHLAVERGEPVPTARAAVGHYRAGEAPRYRLTAWLQGQSGPVVVEVGRGTARRIGRHDALLRAMAAGRDYRGRPLSERRFQRLVRRWAPVEVFGGDVPAGRYRLRWDAERLLQDLDDARRGDEVTFEYERVA